jgi:hypothetical protein
VIYKLLKESGGIYPTSGGKPPFLTCYFLVKFLFFLARFV